MTNPMPVNLTVNPKNPKNNLQRLPNRRYLKPIICHIQHRVPLGLRRSASLEDRSADEHINFNRISSNTSLTPALTPSLHPLCIRLHPHQLLPEFNEPIARIANEHQFDWWETVANLRPLLEKIILDDQLISEFQDDLQIEDQVFVQFTKSKRSRRRNGICCALDRLCYNEQMILFVTIATDVQVEYNLLSTGSRR